MEDDILFGGDIYTNMEEYIFTIEWPTSAPTTGGMDTPLSTTKTPTMTPYDSSTGFPTSTIRHQNAKVDFNLLRPPSYEKEEKSSIGTDKPPKRNSQDDTNDNNHSPTPSSNYKPTQSSSMACVKQLDTIVVFLGLSTIFLLLFH